MQTGFVNREEAEKVFIVVQSVAGATITKGYGVNLCIAGNSADGKAAVLADSDTTENLPAFVGVADADIADTGYGRVQCFGFAASVYLSNTGTSVTINQGDPLVPGKGAGGLTSAAPTYANAGFGYILASNVPVAISAAVYCSGFVKCL